LRYRLIAVQSEFLSLLRAFCPRVRQLVDAQPAVAAHGGWEHFVDNVTLPDRGIVAT
jgi:hypothetical protein